MTVELDKAIRVGAVTVAALVNRSVASHSARGVWIHGVKRPVAVLTRQNNVTMAFEIDGLRISLDEFERRFPGKRADFERSATISSAR